MARLIETDSGTNVNIAAAVAIGAYTCATVPRIVYVRALVNQVAGGGDYVVYATLTKSAVEYRVIPTTTATAAAGLLAIGFVSVGIPMDVGDVLTVYLDGLAGDNATPDTRVDFYEQDIDAVDVAEIQAGLATGAALTAVAAQVTNLDGDVVAVAGQVTNLDADVVIVDTVVDAIKVKTDGLGAGGAGVTMISPVSIIGDTVQLVKGDGYYLADGRSLQWSSALWPSLTGAAISCGLFYNGALVLLMAGVVVTGGVGITQTVSVDVTEVQTALLAKGYPGTEPSRGYSFDVEAVLLSGHSITLQRGTATVLDDYTP